MLHGNAKKPKVTANHDWKSKYGDGKDFDTKSDFMMWLHKDPTGDKYVCNKNELTWNWCTKCVRWSSHKSANCTRSSTRGYPTYANVAVHCENVDSDTTIKYATA